MPFPGVLSKLLCGLSAPSVNSLFFTLIGVLKDSRLFEALFKTFLGDFIISCGSNVAHFKSS